MTTPDMEEVVARLEGMEKRLAYQGRLAKHYTGEGATNAIERKMCEESGKDAEALRALLSAHRKMVEALESIAKRTEPHPDDTLADTAKDALKANAIAKAALTGSREHG